MQIPYETTLILTVAASVIILIGMLAFVAYIVKLYSQRQLEFKTNLAILENEFREQILKARIEVQEETINDVAKEIHDNVNQTLTFSKLNLNFINYEDNNQIKEKINFTSSLITDAISALSNLSRSLNSDLLKELGLANVLEIEIDKVNRIANCKAEFEIKGEYIRLPFEKELVIFRITQESIRNAISHGNASLINISLSYFDNVTIEIKDNGKGFDVSNFQNINSATHQGLVNMKKRALAINAFLEIQSEPNSGTTVKLDIPL